MFDRTSFSAPTRRKFLKRSGIFVSTLPFMANAFSDSSENITGIVDTHIHLWAEDKKKFPYQPDPPYSPEYSSTVEHWEADRAGAGISMAIFILGAPYGTDHRFLFHCLKKAPETLRGVCLVNPNVPEGPRILEEMVQEHNIVGVRLQTSWLWGVEWGSPHLETFWEKVGELDIVLQMHLEPEFSRGLERMVEKYPGTRVVIDHLGRPRNGDGVDYMKLLDISAYPNVYMKIAELPSESRQEKPYDNLKPVIRELVRRFTPRRVVWGSSVYRGGMGSAAYRECVTIATGLLDFLSTEEQRQIFVETPRRLFKL